MKKIILAVLAALGIGGMAYAQAVAQQNPSPSRLKSFPTATTNAQDPMPGLTTINVRIITAMRTLTVDVAEGKITKAQAQPLWNQLNNAIQQMVSNLKTNGGGDLTASQVAALNSALDSITPSL